jgi:hypothetical protein
VEVAGHRITLWQDEDRRVWQCSVACLDNVMELHAEVTLAVGPFDELEDVLSHAIATAHSLGGWRAHQRELL